MSQTVNSMDFLKELWRNIKNDLILAYNADQTAIVALGAIIIVMAVIFTWAILDIAHKQN